MNEIIEIIVAVKNIREGDIFRDDKGRPVWEALEDAKTMSDGSVHLAVQHADGGCTVRAWDAKDADWQLAIDRQQDAV